MSAAVTLQALSQRQACASVPVEFDAAYADDLTPALALGGNQYGELLRASERQLQPLFAQALTHLRHFERLAGLGVEPIDGRARRAGGCHEPEPGAALERCEPDFRRGRDIGQHRVPLS